MGGGLIQLATKGAEDVFLTGDPKITFFKAVYNQYTNFSREIIELQPETNFTNGSKSKVIISRNGDLVGSMYIHFKTTQYDKTDRTWATYIDFIDLKIGEILIDRQNGEWLDIWHDLTVSDDKVGGFQPNLTDNSNVRSAGTIEMMGNGVGTHNGGSVSATVLIPLQFWFNKVTGSALPIIALSHAEISLEINFKPISSNNSLAPTVISNCSVFADYYHLDTNERKIFMNNEIQYLIEQVQMEEDPEITSIGSETHAKASFNFNHPVKEIIWTIKNNTTYRTKIDTAYITLNGNDLTSPLPSMYFTHVEPLKYHSRIPRNGNIFLQSFAIRPEEHQPSGTCNFSRISKGILRIKEDETFNTINIYATNYNILRITNGQAGLPFGK